MEIDYQQVLSLLVDEGTITLAQAKEATARVKKQTLTVTLSAKQWEIAHRLCEHLQKRVTKNGFRAFRITKSNLCDIEYLMRTGNFTEAEVQGVIDWSQSDSFWAGNITDTESLRRNFDRLYNKRKQQGFTLPLVDRTEEIARNMAELEKRLEKQRAEAVPMPAGFKESLRKVMYGNQENN